MSDLLDASIRRNDFRNRYLMTASTLVLIGCVGAIGSVVAAEDESRATVWIELGGQLEKAGGGQEMFSPFFMPTLAEHDLLPPSDTFEPANYSNGIEGAISFQPHKSIWKVIASVRYGRSNKSKSVHAQTPNPSFHCYLGTLVNKSCTLKHPNFSDVGANTRDSHAILDFSAGRDVGLGILGPGSRTSIAVGMRFAQFSSTAKQNIDTIPDAYAPNNFKYSAHRHMFDVIGSQARSFRGIGPSASLNGMVSLAESQNDLQILLDWGINAAVLFGKQRAHVAHTTQDTFYTTNLLNPINHSGMPKYNSVHYPPHVVNSIRFRSVVVPNIGATAGLSFRYANAKVSFGYRADAFFGAMDGGMDTHKSYNRNFYGPFATISIGLGG